MHTVAEADALGMVTVETQIVEVAALAWVPVRRAEEHRGEFTGLEVFAADLDEASRERLAEVYERSIVELSEALSPDLQEELASLVMPFGEEEVPSESELRIAQAQLVGWLEGLFHGIQATLFAQQMAAQQQLEQIKSTQALPPGGRPPSGGGGVYL